jgi:RNA polymerase sigma factor (sigma-70 family)
VNESSDHDLLNDFARQRSEACFAELVRRYVDLVYSTALRLTRDPPAAQDVTQSVFSALAQQAAALAKRPANGPPLSAWLHLTTRNIATKMIRGEVRRRAREREALMMLENSGDETQAVWDRIAPHLDDVLEELPEADRHALLLRFFERRPAREIGLRLGVSEEAAQKRVSRALGRLRERFLARGVTAHHLLSVTALALALEDGTVQSAPLALANCLTKASVIAAIGTPAATTFSAKLVTSLAMTKAQTAIVTAVAAALLIPLGIQRAEVKALRGAIANATPVALPPEPQSPIHSPETTGNQPTGAELARLTRLRDELQTRSRQKQATRSALSSLARPAGPTLLRPGQTVSLAELGFAGNATPEAALQSSLVLARDGDVSGFFQLALVPPSQVNHVNDVLASPDGTEKFRQELADMLRGVVESSSVELGADKQTVLSHREERHVPDNPTGIVNLQLISSRQIDDRNVQLVIGIERGGQTTTETLSLGLTATGWKQVPPL